MFSALRARVNKSEIPDPWILLDTLGDVLYWRSRESDELWCGSGCAFEDSSLNACLGVLSEIDSAELLPFSPRCFGLIAFDPSVPLSQIWKGFSRQQFWIPEILIRYQGSQADSIVITRRESAEQPQYDDNLVNAPATQAQCLSESSNQSFDEWRHAIDEILSRIRSNALHKAVLARQVELEADGPFRISEILSRLADSSPEAYLFACRKAGSGVFFGASPECLFRMKGRSVVVDSLAGSRPRNKDHRTDQQLSEELTLSDKDLKEQRFVTDYIRDKLALLCTDLHISDTRVKNLATIRHLYSEIIGTIKDSVTAESILKQLHPTPAICGSPTDAARRLIGELEPDARGLYAGAVGFADLQSAEFAVSIRSGLIRDRRALLFAGAGIVADSVADNEYNECEWKFAELRQALFPDQ